MQPILNNQELTFLNQILAGLHEDDNYEKAFTVFLERLKDLVKFQKGDIYFYENKDEHVNFEDFIFVEWGDNDLENYLQQYADIDDALPIVAINQPIMFRSTDVFIQDERMKTRYYNELLCPAKMHYSIEGNIYVGDDKFVAGVGLHRPEEFGDFSQKELEILKFARPHLANVARKYLENRQNQNLDAYSATLEMLYDFNDIGIFIWDKNLKLINHNLGKNDFIKSQHREELMRTMVTLCKSLMEKIRKNGVSAVPEDNKVHSRITISHISYYAEVIYKQEAGDRNGRFIAMVYNCANVLEKFLYEIKCRFDLTEREYEILKKTMGGKSNSEISKELFISIPTVKKHLTNIYCKIGIEGKHQIFSAIIG